LSEHRSRVFTVMTTNDKDKIPVELWRPGRIDKVLYLELMDAKKAFQFACEAFHQIMDREWTSSERQIIADCIGGSTGFSPARIDQMIKNQIKMNNWV
jgi:SpoVK/Ycf46/Vps4 family AAA+-type ATPase